MDIIEDLIQGSGKYATIHDDRVFLHAVQRNRRSIQTTALQDFDIRIRGQGTKIGRCNRLSRLTIANRVRVTHAKTCVCHIALRDVDRRIGKPTVLGRNGTVGLGECNVVRFERTNVNRPSVFKKVRRCAVTLENQLAVTTDRTRIV